MYFIVLATKVRVSWYLTSISSATSLQQLRHLVAAIHRYSKFNSNWHNLSVLPQCPVNYNHKMQDLVHNHAGSIFTTGLAIRCKSQHDIPPKWWDGHTLCRQFPWFLYKFYYTVDQWLLPVSVRRYKIETAVDTVVFDVLAVQSCLILVVLIILTVDVVSNGLPADQSK